MADDLAYAPEPQAEPPPPVPDQQPAPQTYPPIQEAPPPTIYDAPQGFVFHHTGGSTVDGARATLSARGLGSQYIMDRDGSIYDYAQPGAPHIMPNDQWGGRAPGLTNANALGMEVVAKDDSDVTPAQVAAAQRFIYENYRNTPVYGHGEVNPGHKQASEGMSIVNTIRHGRDTGWTPDPLPGQITPERADDLQYREAAGDLSPTEQEDLTLFRRYSMMPHPGRFRWDDPIFQATEKKYGLDKYGPNVLPALMATETGDYRNPHSGGDPFSMPKGPTHGRGLMQITPGTGGEYGMNDYNWSNPYLSVDVAGRALRAKIDAHGGTLDGGLRSYGPPDLPDYVDRVHHAMGALGHDYPVQAPVQAPAQAPPASPTPDTATAGPPTVPAPPEQSPDVRVVSGYDAQGNPIPGDLHAPVATQSPEPSPGVSPLQVETTTGPAPETATTTTPTTRSWLQSFGEREYEAAGRPRTVGQWLGATPTPITPEERAGIKEPGILGPYVPSVIRRIVPPVGRVLMAAPGSAAGATVETERPTGGETGPGGAPLPQAPGGRQLGDVYQTGTDLALMGKGAVDTLGNLYYGRTTVPFLPGEEGRPELLPGSAGRRRILGAVAADEAATRASQDVAARQADVAAARGDVAGARGGAAAAGRDAAAREAEIRGAGQAVSGEARRGAQADIETMRGQQRDIEDVEAGARRDLPGATDQAVTAARQHQLELERDFLEQRNRARAQENDQSFNQRRLAQLDQLAEPTTEPGAGTQRVGPRADTAQAMRRLRAGGYTGPASITAPDVPPTRQPSAEMGSGLTEQRAAFQEQGERLARYQNYVDLATRARTPETRLFYARQAEQLAEREIPEVTRAASLQRQIEELGPEGRQGITRAMQDRRAALQGQLNDVTDRMNQMLDAHHQLTAEETAGAQGEVQTAQERLQARQQELAGARTRRVAAQAARPGQEVPREIKPMRKAVTRKLAWGAGLALPLAGYWNAGRIVRAYRALSSE